MIDLSLVVGDSWGAGVMGHNLVPAMADLTETRLIGRVSPGHPLEKYCPEGFSPDVPFTSENPMLHLATGGCQFLPVNQNAWSWKRNVGWIYLEFPVQAQKFLPHARRFYDQMVGGSTWCRDHLIEMGLKNTALAIQGVDADVFCPKPGIGPKDDKFYIFSGGKAEYRKGTDVVMAAFKILSQKYPDMHLLAAWGNLWPETMGSLSASRLIRYIPTIGQDWKTRMQGNLTVNGIPSNRYTLIDMVPNWQMQDIYRKAHMGLFPNRGEAGNNMPMCECMACGVPVVATEGTGHGDVIHPDWSIPVGGNPIENDWVDPDLDEVVAAVEKMYGMSAADRHSMAESAVGMVREHLTWTKCAKDLLTICEA